MKFEVPDEVLKQSAEEYVKFLNFLGSGDKLKDLREEARRRLSPTPRTLVYQEHSTALYHYKPAQKAGLPPLLIIPSLVNKPCIMDLLKGQSFIEGMLAMGIECYMLEWGTPTAAQARYPLRQYILGYLDRAVRRTRMHSGAAKISLAGYCLGGALSVIYSAATQCRDLHSLIAMVTPVNFHDRGLLSYWAKEDHFDVDRIVDTWGNVPADFFSASFPWLAPTANIKKVRTIYDKQNDDDFLIEFLALDMWITENIPFPGECYREIIRQGYQKNTLAEEGIWTFDNGEVARLSDITVPVLIQAATYDHVSPIESCKILKSLLTRASAKESEYPIGHLGLALGKDGRNQSTTEYWQEIYAFLANANGKGAYGTN